MGYIVLICWILLVEIFTFKNFRQKSKKNKKQIPEIPVKSALLMIFHLKSAFDDYNEEFPFLVLLWVQAEE